MEDKKVPSTELTEDVKKKKKKKKKAPKEERRKAREAELLNAIYSPKDTHVKLVSQKALSQLRISLEGPGQIKTQKLAQLAPGLFSSHNFPILHEFNFHDEFPDLSSNSSSKVKLTETSSNERILKALAEEKARSEESKDKTSPTKDTQVPTYSKASSTFSKEGVSNSGPTESKRKARKPVVIKLDDLLNESKKKAEEKKKEGKLGNSIQKGSIASQLNENKKTTGGNLLDSSGPATMKRGKIRKKKKKPSKLKKAILISRTVRQISMQMKRDKTESLIPPVLNGEDETTTGEFFADQTVVSEIVHNINSPNDFIDSQLVLEQCPNPYYVDEPESNWIPQPAIPFIPIIPPDYAIHGIDLMSYNMVNNHAHHLFHNTLINYETYGPIEFIPLQSPPEVQEAQGETLALTTEACEGTFSNGNQCKAEESEEEKITQLFNSSLKVEEGEVGINDPIISEQPPIPSSLIDVVKDQLHSKKFRKYCDMYCSKELHGHVINLLKELYRFQDRVYKTDPNKLKTKRRYVHGLKDVASSLDFNKVCLLIIAPNIEQNSVKGGLDDKLREIINMAQEKKVPYIFSGNRFFLGKPIGHKTPVSIIAVIDKHGAEELFQLVLEESDKLRASYNEDFNKLLVHHSTNFV